MDEETRRIHRLLSGGKLSGPEAEEILENVLAEVAREKPRRVVAIPYWAGALAAAAALLLFFVPRAPGPHVPTSEGYDLPALQLRCSPGSLSACPKSSSLVFSLFGPRTRGVLSAYAEPLTPAAQPVFYFSKQDQSPELATLGEDASPSVIAALIPASQTPGRYRVHAVLADRALTRDELIQGAPERAGGPEIRARLKLELVVQE